ncbi:MAG: cupin domain-containing protein [Acidimicrobiales bacterium]|nr:cupin domain-containing protein [Acidimicrobiales bacterium]
MAEQNLSTFVVEAGAGRPGMAESGPYHEIASRNETGAFRLLHNSLAPGVWAHQMHRHPDSESFYVLEGSFEMHIEGREVTVLGPGSFVYIPSDVPHTFVTGPEGGSKLTLIA